MNYVIIIAICGLASLVGHCVCVCVCIILLILLAVWLSGNALGLNQRSCAMSDPVSTRMGDHLWTGKPSRYVTSRLGRLSLLPSVGW